MRPTGGVKTAMKKGTMRFKKEKEEKMWKGEQRQRFVVTYNGTPIFLIPPKEDEHDGQIQVKDVTIDL